MLLGRGGGMSVDKHIKHFKNAKDLWLFYNKVGVSLTMKQAIMMWNKLKKNKQFVDLK